MKRLFVILVFVVALPVSSATAPRGDVVSQFPLGDQVIQPAASTALTVPTGALHAIISVRAAGVMLRDNGVAPTSTTGFYVPAGTILKIDNDPKWLASMRFICSDDAGTCKVYVIYYRNRKPTE